MCRQRGLVLVVCTLLLSVNAQQSPLFPALTGESAADKPIAASATCGVIAQTFCNGGTCLTCDSACPLEEDTSLRTTEPTSVAQPECLCADPFLYARQDQCCDALGQGANCISRLNVDAHPVQYGNDDSLVTYWQSPTNADQVHVTLDLGIEHEILSVTMAFSRLVPHSVVVERSLDGETFEPHQYFSLDCEGVFGVEADSSLDDAEQVLCESSSSNARKSEIVFETLTPARLGLGGGSYALSEELQRFTRARYVRLSFAKLHTSETATDTFGNPLPTEPFYRLSMLKVTSRCSCNGHASQCSADSEGELQCSCQHDTDGTTCNRCKPLFNGKPWVRGAETGHIACVACECNGHADSCHYDSTVDSNPQSRSSGNGGVCDDCKHNTAGRFCESCAPFFFKTPGQPRDSLDACTPCNCSSIGVSNDGSCQVETGNCVCKQNVMGRQCDECEDGFYGLAATNALGCSPCACNAFGTESGHTATCDKGSGQCACKSTNEGRDCSQCKTGFFRPAGGMVGQCQACDAQCSPTAGCTGDGPDKCLECKSVRQNGVCVEQCDSDYYADADGICRPCNDQCTGGCSGPGASVEVCNACKNFEFQGICVGQCPSSSYPDGAVCKPCDPQCAGCTGPLNTQCKACQNVKLGSTCVATCPTAQYADNQGVCQPCNAQCDESAGCTGPEASQCTKCRGVFDLTSGASPFDCAGSCPSQSYSVVRSFAGFANVTVCYPCHSQCAGECTGPGPDECGGVCKNLLHEDTCVAACPLGTFARLSKFCTPCNPLCDSASGCTGPLAEDCGRCGDDAFVLSDGKTCVADCPAGTYPDNNRQCQPCHPACAECSGPGVEQCTKCKKYAMNDQCIEACPLDRTYVADSSSGMSVMTTLLPETTPDDVDDDDLSGDFETTAEPVGDPGDAFSPFVCLPCNSLCEGGCFGPNADECKGCRLVEFGGECFESCPVGSFKNAAGCDACDRRCLNGCTGPDATECNECRDFEVDGQCVTSCPAARFADGKDCKRCHPSCSTADKGCTGPDSSDCVACERLRLSTTMECVNRCPNGFFINETMCEPCDDNCVSCTGPGPDQCPQCRAVKFDGVCMSECPFGTFPGQDKICQRCSVQCFGDCFADGPSSCLPDVDTGRLCLNFQRDGTCVQSCDSSAEYEDDGHCRSCDPQCVGGCTGPSPSQCKQCANVALDGTCVAACPADHFSNSNGECIRCHQQCAANLNGTICFDAGPANCGACRNVKDGDRCVASCPSDKVAIAGQCQACHPQCKGGCSDIGPDACQRCSAWQYLGVCVPECPVSSAFANQATLQCEPCHPECSTDLARGGCPLGTKASHCLRCRHYRQDGECVASCGQGYFPDTTDTSSAVLGVCRPCDASCDPEAGCYGSGPSKCNRCASFEMGGVCYDACPAFTFVDGRSCRSCDPACLRGCTGPGPDNCLRDPNPIITNATTLGCRDVADIQQAVVVCTDSCPVGEFPDQHQLCRSCHPSCPAELGCTGPGPSACNSCPPNEFLDAARTCQACSSACKGGCTGPSTQDCLACKGARLGSDCVSACPSAVAQNDPQYFLDTSDPSEARCQLCSSLCALGGCSGPGPDDCLAGCKELQDEVSGACVATCASDQYLHAASRTCRQCASVCKGGCIGPNPSQCNDCAFARLPSGECVAECPEGQVPDTSGVCHCPTDRSFVGKDGTCIACSIECANGCFGPTAADCIGVPQDCRVAAQDGVCVAMCTLGRQSINKICQCPSSTYADRQTGECRSCHRQCDQERGCSGPGADQCNKCRSVKLDGQCAADCGIGHAAGSDGETCESCHVECLGGCNTPQDSAECKKCRNYLDGRDCVGTCPETRMFEDGGTCVSACPVTRPYYNDTRLPDGDGFSMPAACVSTCEMLNDPSRVYVSSAAPYRCTTLARIQSDRSSGSTDVSDPESVAAILLGCVAVVLVLLAIVVVMRRRRSGVSNLEYYDDVSESADGPRGAWEDQVDSRTFRNAVYVPAMANDAVNPYASVGALADPGPEAQGYISVEAEAEDEFYPPNYSAQYNGPNSTEADSGDFDYLMNSSSL